MSLMQTLKSNSDTHWISENDKLYLIDGMNALVGKQAQSAFELIVDWFGELPSNSDDLPYSMKYNKDNEVCLIDNIDNLPVELQKILLKFLNIVDNSEN